MNIGCEYELGFDALDFGPPDVITNREALERYCGYYLSWNQFNPLSVFKEIHEFQVIRPKERDDLADGEFDFDDWACTDSNNTRV